MRTYVNKKTGAGMSSPFAIVGDDWEEITPPGDSGPKPAKAQETEKPAEKKGSSQETAPKKSAAKRRG